MREPLELVKNTKRLKFPHANKSVRGTLRRAADHAQKEGWTRIIIIGEGKNDCRSLYSKLDNYTSLGMLMAEVGAIQKDLLK